MSAQPSLTPDAPRADARQAPRVVVAGIGLVTPLGHGAWASFGAIAKGQTIAGRTSELPDDVAGTDLVRAVGAVSAVQHAADDPAVELAEQAAREAAFEAKTDLPGLPCFIGTSKGAVHRLHDALDRRSRGATLQPAHAEVLAYGPHGYLSAALARRTRMAVRSHSIGACASSLMALDQARRFLQSGESKAEQAIVITSEAALLPLFILSYKRLGVLPPLSPGEYRERPLDERRAGFMLSELAAAVVLRRLPEGQQPDVGELELVDTAVAAEAYDLIRPAPTMPALRHIATRLLAGRSVDAIHPHAPGTAEHDTAELGVLADVLKQSAEARPDARPTDVYACKGALGHGLGAAGLTSLVLASMCLRTGSRPPMPWLDQPIAAPGLAISPEPRELSRIGTHAVFAAGFGGHTAGAVIQRH